MRIMQIQLMSESSKWTFARRPVALALAGVVSLTAFQYLLGAQPKAATAIAAAAPTFAGTTYSGNLAPRFEGRAVAVDGDTLEVDGRRVRLEGIDAPEMGQTCGRRWFGSWNCGREAQRALDKLVEGRRVSCEGKGRDKYGRDLGVCFVDGRDINGELVRQGLAWAFVKYSRSYVGEEDKARSQKVGIWQGSAEPAWAYREAKWQTAATSDQAPDGCAIKGNITGNGKIYHVPWGDWYSRVKVEANKGERWFCTEAEAIAAGWRPAISH